MGRDREGWGSGCVGMPCGVSTSKEHDWHTLLAVGVLVTFVLAYCNLLPDRHVQAVCGYAVQMLLCA